MKRQHFAALAVASFTVLIAALRSYAPRRGTSSRSTTAARWSAWATLPRAVAGTSVGRGVRFA
jgi:hypothetical protein